jgi:DNA-binding GntR family transcriptional regulator
MLFRSFHESIVAHCGNQTLIVLVGALEAIWSENVRVATARSTKKRTAKELERSLRDHQIILHRIEQGDARGVTRAVVDHISRVQAAATRANADNRIVLPMVRKNVRAISPDSTNLAPVWQPPAGASRHDAGHP